MAKSSTNKAALDRKAKNVADNEARHQANLDKMNEAGITPRIASVTKVRRRNGIPVRDKKGSTVEYTKKFEVTPSALLRSKRRENEDLKSKWVEAATRSGLRPAEGFSTAQHLEAASRRPQAS